MVQRHEAPAICVTSGKTLSSSTAREPWRTVGSDGHQGMMAHEESDCSFSLDSIPEEVVCPHHSLIKEASLNQSHQTLWQT